MVNKQQLIEIVTKQVMKQLEDLESYKITVGISNRHVHVSKEDLETLFGKGYELTVKSNLKQPGQFAANETITLRGPKGEFENVRILGPVRKNSQVEISKTDSFKLGVKPPIKESGELDNTPGLELVGPKGIVRMPKGTIIALRHIHFTPEQATKMGVKDKDVVSVETFGERHGVLGDVLVRVSDQFSLEMHVDVDEANACALNNGDYVILRK